MAEAKAQKQAMDADAESAVAELKALAKVKGALKIITAEVRPELRENANDPASGPKMRAGDDEQAVDLRSAKTFVLHDVVKIEGPDDRGRYVALSDEGDWTMGYPSALVRRLRQWRED